ncbi:MAG: hypothetical protein ACRDKV_02660 [Solirubrobacterales bacterium]
MNAEARPTPYGAAAGAGAVILFVIGALVIGSQPAFDAPGAEVAEHLEDKRTRIHIGLAANAAAMPLMVWFLATVASLAGGAGMRARRVGAVAYGCGLIFIALFLVDNTALAVSALRPENMAASPELAATLRDFEWLPQGMAAPLGTTMLAAFSVMALRDAAVWPPWVGWLAAAAAAVYAIRIGILFTTEGPFAVDGVLGLWLPVSALLSWVFVAGATLALRLRREAPPPDHPKEPARLT